MDETLAVAQLERVQAFAETMVGAASQTIRPVRGVEGATTGGRSDAALELLRGLGPGQVRVELGETLGQGGMGLVRLGRQLAITPVDAAGNEGPATLVDVVHEGSGPGCAVKKIGAPAPGWAALSLFGLLALRRRRSE